MTFDLISPSQQDALEALATYRFLTVKQLVRLGVSSSESSLRNNTLADLKARRYKSPRTGKTGPAIIAADLGRWQKLPFVHHLTEVGADLLADLWKVADVPYPVGGAQFGKQFFHRIAQVDFHIALRLWAAEHGAEVKLADMDFDKIGAQRTGGMVAKTKVQIDQHSFIIPDGIFGVLANQTPFLFALEVHDETDTGYITRQLMRHGNALMNGSIAKKYHQEASNFVLSVMEETRHSKNDAANEETAQKRVKAVQSRMLHQPYFDSFKAGYFFNTIHQVRRDIREGWTTADGVAVRPFG